MILKPTSDISTDRKWTTRNDGGIDPAKCSVVTVGFLRSKGKGIPVHVMKVYGGIKVKVSLSRYECLWGE